MGRLRAIAAHCAAAWDPRATLRSLLPSRSGHRFAPLDGEGRALATRAALPSREARPDFTRLPFPHIAGVRALALIWVRSLGARRAQGGAPLAPLGPASERAPHQAPASLGRAPCSHRQVLSYHSTDLSNMRDMEVTGPDGNGLTQEGIAGSWLNSWTTQLWQVGAVAAWAGAGA